MPYVQLIFTCQTFLLFSTKNHIPRTFASYGYKHNTAMPHKIFTPACFPCSHLHIPHKHPICLLHHLCLLHPLSVLSLLLMSPQLQPRLFFTPKPPHHTHFFHPKFFIHLITIYTQLIFSPNSHFYYLP